MRSTTRRPRLASRRSPEAVIDPSGKAKAVATLSRSGVSGLISSRDGRVVCFIVPVPVGLPPARALTGARCNPKIAKGPLGLLGMVHRLKIAGMRSGR